MKKASLILAALTVLFMMSCKNNKKSDQDSNAPKDKTEMAEPSDTMQITLSEIKDYPAYDDVSLSLEEPTKTKLEPGKNSFKFDVENMKLGEQTDNANSIGMANSDKGQHIHYIIDDKPYMAHYNAEFDHKLDEGRHILVAFPARSYHMSVKNKKAVVAKKLTVGDPENNQFKDFDLSSPTLIYSRPKGTYQGDDTKKVMLDFYLLNVDLSADGYKVRATINDQEFMLDDWAPYAIEGLPMGKTTIKLELVDKDGKLAEGAFNRVERTITLKK